MSFRIHAAGTGGFRHDREGIDFGDVYEFADGLSRMYSVTGGVRSFASGEATGAVEDVVVGDSALRRSLNAMGQLVGANLLREMVILLAATRTPVRISVAARREGMIFTESAFREVVIYADDMQPAVEFFRAISPALQAAEMNTFGVMSAIARVLSEFMAHPCHRGGDGQYRVLIQLSA